MAVSHRGAISFGLVHIPVGLYTTTREFRLRADLTLFSHRFCHS